MEVSDALLQKCTDLIVSLKDLVETVEDNGVPFEGVDGMLIRPQNIDMILKLLELEAKTVRKEKVVLINEKKVSMEQIAEALSKGRAKNIKAATAEEAAQAVHNTFHGAFENIRILKVGANGAYSDMTKEMSNPETPDAAHKALKSSIRKLRRKSHS